LNYAPMANTIAKILFFCLFMRCVFFAPRAVLFELKFFLDPADILVRIVIIALAIRAPESN